MLTYTIAYVNKLPAALEIDLGKTETIKGFKYLPDQNWWADGSIITQYEFYVSTDQKNWKLMSSGEFSNIKNSPFWQTKTFDLTNARYIKLIALKNVGENSAAGYAEIDVLTQ